MLKTNNDFFSRKSFEKLGCTDHVIKYLKILQFIRPLHIQAMAFEPVIDGKSCIVTDQSGSETEMIKDILMNKEGVFLKMDMDDYVKKLLGEALITNEGEKWVKIWKLANRTFHVESLKSMVPEMSSSVAMMLERWKDYEGKEIDVFKELGMLTAEVISRTAFMSSYLEGKHVFEMVAKLTAITVRSVYYVKILGIKSS